MQGVKFEGIRSEADALLGGGVEDEGLHVLAAFAHIESNHHTEGESGDHHPDGSAQAAAALLLLKGHTGRSSLVAVPAWAAIDEVNCESVACFARITLDTVAGVSHAGAGGAVGRHAGTASAAVVVDEALLAFIADVDVGSHAHRGGNDSEGAVVGAALGTGLAHSDVEVSKAVSVVRGDDADVEERTVLALGAGGEAGVGEGA